MPNNNEKIAKDKLELAFDNFALLKSTLNNFSNEELLSMSSSIRNNIKNDSCISLECKNNKEIAGLRKSLLDKINTLQKNIFEDITQTESTIAFDEKINITNYIAANEELLKIAQSEKKEWAKNNNSLYADINDFAKHLTTLCKIAARSKDSDYKVLLMGGYQSGKTTLVDAIIGKHIGAIGDGNTTSAVPIAISYGNSVSVSLQWKDKKFILSLLSSIKKYIEDFMPEDFDIESKSCREDLYNKIDSLRQKDICPKAKEPGAKVLALCSIILKYFGDQRLSDIARNDVKLSSVSKLSRFPKKFEARWRKKGGDNFLFEESIFAFIEKINCFVPSELLRQLNCTFIDSPGLFSSNDYDTKVTEREMLNANAILYLLPYEKEVGEDNSGSLYILRNNYTDITRKLFIVNNRCSYDQKNFFKANRETIEDMFDSKMDLCKIDARLAYLGSLKKSFDKGVLSQEEINQFISSCQQEIDERKDEDDDIDTKQLNTFMEAWDECMVMYKIGFRWSDIPTTDEVIKKSHLQDVLHKLLDFIDRNRAYSFIVSEGIFKLYNDLSSIRKTIRTLYIDPYIKGKEITKILWENRIKRVDEFEITAKTIVNKHLFESSEQFESLNKRLADSVCAKIFTVDSMDQLMIRICREIYNNKWSLTKCGKNEDKIKKCIEPKIKNIISEYILERVGYWNDLIKHEQDQSFNNTFAAQIKLLVNDLNSKWKEIFEKDDESFIRLRNRYYEVSMDTKSFSLGGVEYNGKGFSTGNISFMGSLLNDIGVIVAGITALLIPTIISIIIAVASNPLGWAIGGTVALFGAGYYACTGNDMVEQRFVNKYAPNIKKKFEENDINETFRKFIFEGVNHILNEYATTIKINKLRIENDRDTNLSSSDKDIEQKCFAGVKLLSDIEKYIKKYSNFVDKFIIKNAED